MTGAHASRVQRRRCRRTPGTASAGGTPALQSMRSSVYFCLQMFIQYATLLVLLFSFKNILSPEGNIQIWRLDQ